jgi:dephospho-CoA kinase
VPLLLENKINNKKDILVFVQSKKLDIIKRLKKRDNFNKKLWSKFKNIQLPLDYKKKKSQFIIKNDFTKKSVKKDIRNILNEIL